MPTSIQQQQRMKQVDAVFETLFKNQTINTFLLQYIENTIPAIPLIPHIPIIPLIPHIPNNPAGTGTLPGIPHERFELPRDYIQFLYQGLKVKYSFKASQQDEISKNVFREQLSKAFVGIRRPQFFQHLFGILTSGHLTHSPRRSSKQTESSSSVLSSWDSTDALMEDIDVCKMLLLKCNNADHRSHALVLLILYVFYFVLYHLLEKKDSSTPSTPTTPLSPLSIFPNYTINSENGEILPIIVRSDTGKY